MEVSTRVPDATGHHADLLDLFLTSYPEKCLVKVLSPHQSTSWSLFRLIPSQRNISVIRNKWWKKLKDRIMSFTIEFSQRLALDKTNKVKALNDRLSQAGAGGDLLDRLSCTGPGAIG